jgi:hypothetical protein
MILSLALMRAARAPTKPEPHGFSIERFVLLVQSNCRLVGFLRRALCAMRANKYFAFHFRHPEKINQPVEAGSDRHGLKLGGHAGDVTGSAHSPVRRLVGSSRRSRGSARCGFPISAFRFHETHLRGDPIKLYHVRSFPKRPRPIQIASVECKFTQRMYYLSRGPDGVPDQICGGAQTGHSASNLRRARNSLARKCSCLSEGQFIVPLVMMAKLTVDDLRAAYGISPGTGASSSVGFARASKLRNARAWSSSTSAVPRQSDEALAKSSAKWINFSRQAGSFISRNALIKRTPSLGSAASGSRSLLTSSS